MNSNKQNENNDSQNNELEIIMNNKDLMLETLTKELIKKIEIIGLDINISNIPDIVGYAMEIVELRRALHNSSKKQFVLKIIKYLSSKFLKDDDNKIVNQMIENGIIERTIEVIIATSKGKMIINTVKEGIEETKEVIENLNKNCFTLCFKGKSKNIKQGNKIK